MWDVAVLLIILAAWGPAAAQSPAPSGPAMRPVPAPSGVARTPGAIPLRDINNDNSPALGPSGSAIPRLFAPRRKGVPPVPGASGAAAVPAFGANRALGLPMP